MESQVAGMICHVTGAPTLWVVIFSQPDSPRFDPLTVTRVSRSAVPVTP